MIGMNKLIMLCIIVFRWNGLLFNLVWLVFSFEKFRMLLISLSSEWFEFCVVWM